MSVTLPQHYSPQYQATLMSRAFKSSEMDVTPKGEVSSYLTVYNDPDGDAYVDSYEDVVVPGFMTKTIADLKQARSWKGSDYLCPYLWQHETHEPIGGVKSLVEDSKGVYYVAQLAMGSSRAQDCAALIKEKILGSSYGYDVVKSHFMASGHRALQEVKLWEVSAVTFPANELVGYIDIKQDNVYGLYPSTDRFARRLMGTGPQRYKQHIEEQHARHVHAISELDRQARRFFQAAEPSPMETRLDSMDRTIRRLKAGY